MGSVRQGNFTGKGFLLRLFHMRRRALNYTWIYGVAPLAMYPLSAVQEVKGRELGSPRSKTQTHIVSDPLSRCVPQRRRKKM